MGNFFIGFPVPRAKIATMIETAAPPLEHVENHFPDGSDPIVLPDDIGEGQILTWNGAKFVGSDAPAAVGYPSPISIHPSAFLPERDTVDYQRTPANLWKLTTLGSAMFYAPVILPHGSTITKLTLFGYRDDSEAYLDLYLGRITNAGSNYEMALISADWTNGSGSGYDDTILYSTIDNSSYSYYLKCVINPNDHVDDVILISAQIDFE